MSLPPNYAAFKEAISEYLNPYFPFDLEAERNPKDRSLKRDLLVDYVKTGGIEGGSCYSESDDDLQEFSTGDRLGDFKELNDVLIRYWPDITYLQHRALCSVLIHETTETYYEYYGNRDDYDVQYIVAEELYEYLKGRVS